VDEAAALPGDAANRVRRNALIQQAGAMSVKLRTRYPDAEHAVRGTALGNALAAMEDSAGAAYGLDAVVAWPRLYPLLGEQVRALVDDLRDGLDAAARLAATCALTALITVGLLVWHSGWWTALALAPAVLAMVAYAGAVRAAVAYGDAVRVAFDLHRFDLLRALRLAVPSNQIDEQAANGRLCDFLRQGVPVPFTYADSTPPGGGPTP
jgi:hypothetical protein